MTKISEIHFFRRRSLKKRVLSIDILYFWSIIFKDVLKASFTLF